MNSERDLVLLADGIARLEDELADATTAEDRSEIKTLLGLARETHATIKARIEKKQLAPCSDTRAGILAQVGIIAR